MFDVVTRGVLRKKRTGESQEKNVGVSAARTKTKNEVVNKGDRPYTLENTASTLRTNTEAWLCGRRAGVPESVERSKEARRVSVPFHV